MNKDVYNRPTQKTGLELCQGSRCTSGGGELSYIRARAASVIRAECRCSRGAPVRSACAVRQVPGAGGDAPPCAAPLRAAVTITDDSRSISHA